jgi:hypothetical protein
LAAVVAIASVPAPQHFDGRLAGGCFGPFFTQHVLTVDEIVRLFELGQKSLETREVFAYTFPFTFSGS